MIKETPIVRTKNKTTLPDGFYTGTVGGANVKITSQDYYGINIELKYGIKGTNISAIVVVKNGFGYIFTQSIKY